MEISKIAEDIWLDVFENEKMSLDRHLLFYNYIYNMILESEHDKKTMDDINNKLSEKIIELFEKQTIKFNNLSSINIYTIYKLTYKYIKIMNNTLCCLNYYNNKSGIEDMVNNIFYSKVLKINECKIIDELNNIVLLLHENMNYDINNNMFINMKLIYSMLIKYNSIIQLIMEEQYSIIINKFYKNINKSLLMNEYFLYTKNLFDTEKYFQFLYSGKVDLYIEQIKKILYSEITFVDIETIVKEKDTISLNNTIQNYFRDVNFNNNIYLNLIGEHFSKHIVTYLEECNKSEVYSFVNDQLFDYYLMIDNYSIKLEIFNVDFTNKLLKKMNLNNVSELLASILTNIALDNNYYNKLIMFFKNVFIIVKNVDEFLYFYNMKFQKRILHRNLVIKNEEMIQLHFMENIQMNSELYRYKILLNDYYLSYYNIWNSGLLLSNLYFNYLCKVDIIYHPLLIEKIEEYRNKYSIVYSDRILYFDCHYSMTELEFELNDKRKQLCISFIGANIILYGIEYSFDKIILASKMNVNVDIVDTWIKHLLEKKILIMKNIIQFEPTYFGVIPTPSYEKCNYTLNGNHSLSQVIEKRPEVIEAYIVKILKNEKTVSEKDLYSTVKKVIIYFEVYDDDITKQIENLIKKEYIQYDNGMYIYLP